LVKLSKRKPSPAETVIHVEGRLDHSVMADFQGLIESCPSGERPTIDLSGMESIDLVARGYLLRLRASGFRLVRGSLYINRVLDEEV